ncbi:3-isopropylmalate dehydratase small subunit [Jeotgalibacillus sp. R-1-5s-1]|uniref:3-isopropylmalate dehydratase small subunit n=1 Tax=Jeotgalibacillus sp. R-1-5s-1 TaxID=2555897 RepID=UPI00106AB1F3|nr:3-isopropylmalate dehydratase small subunit [Jeotgalibacillus sp. R-1-5s-1]TFE03623.1 3-isopropylmalate dehydratase small subunit [Jeotgalibacillus sp. R-1-5s-1]
MEPVKKLSSTITPLDRINVDTDQIIPKQFLKRIERTGFGQFLFYGWRFNADGSPNEKFILNQPPYKDSEILVAGHNFGCGSSREHAPWALQDYGFKIIIAPSFADIFYNNCVKNGILAIRLEESKVKQLLEGGKEKQSVTVDLESQSIHYNGEQWTFDIDPYWKQMLLNGWDEISITFQYEDEIRQYEEQHH